jgi:hypothetical protein
VGAFELHCIWMGIFKENIFFVPVSKTPNLKVIVDRLFHHRGQQVSEFELLLESHITAYSIFILYS